MVINDLTRYYDKVCQIGSLVLLLLISSIVWAHSETESNNAYDCTVVQLEEVDEASLTKAERIVRMDESLLDSIDQHDRCIEQVMSNNAANSGTRVGSGSGVGEGEGLEGENESTDGTGESNASAEGNASDESNESPLQSQTQRNAESSGAKNQPIDPVDNDAAICNILKEEMQIEKNPQKQQELKEISKNYNCRS